MRRSPRKASQDWKMKGPHTSRIAYRLPRLQSVFDVGVRSGLSFTLDASVAQVTVGIFCSSTCPSANETGWYRVRHHLQNIISKEL